MNAGISVASVSVSISGSELAVLLDESGETSYALHVEGVASVTGLPGVTLRDDAPPSEYDWGSSCRFRRVW